MKKTNQHASTTNDSDPLGLTRPVRRRERCLCLDLLVHLSDEMWASGLTGVESIPELQRRYYAVLDGEQACPLALACKRRSKPEQLRLL